MVTSLNKFWRVAFQSFTAAFFSGEVGNSFSKSFCAASIPPFQGLDWKGGIDAAQKLFEKELPTSPEKKAAVKDWNATRQNLFSDVTIARFLASDETLFHAEFPFSWRRNDRSVLEGLIDSIMTNRKAGRCLLLDWKTNDVSPSDIEIFRNSY